MINEVTPDGLVVVLGWCVDDFESVVVRAPEVSLRGCLEILESPAVGDERVDQLAAYGSKFVRAELERRGSSS
jgi:hypothetical protein